MNWKFWKRAKPEPVTVKSEPIEAPPMTSLFKPEPVEVPVPKPEPEDDDRMNPGIKAAWVEALRSGEYIQGQGRLRQRKEHEKSKYCCLGVLAEIAVKDGVIDPPRKLPDGSYEYDGDTHVLGTTIQDWASLWDSNPILCDVSPGDNSSLAGMNDDGMSFGEIADVIEKQL